MMPTQDVVHPVAVTTTTEKGKSHETPPYRKNLIKQKPGM